MEKKKKTKQPLNILKKHILISKRHISITLTRLDNNINRQKISPKPKLIYKK